MVKGKTHRIRKPTITKRRNIKGTMQKGRSVGKHVKNTVIVDKRHTKRKTTKHVTRRR